MAIGSGLRSPWHQWQGQTCPERAEIGAARQAPRVLRLRLGQELLIRDQHLRQPCHRDGGMGHALVRRRGLALRGDLPAMAGHADCVVMHLHNGGKIYQVAMRGGLVRSQGLLGVCSACVQSSPGCRGCNARSSHHSNQGQSSRPTVSSGPFCRRSLLRIWQPAADP